MKKGGVQMYASKSDFERLESDFKASHAFLVEHIGNVETFMTTLHNKFGSVEERLGSLEQNFKNLDQKVDKLDQKFEQKFDNLEKKFDNLDQKFDLLDQKFDRMGGRMSEIANDVSHMKTTFTAKFELTGDHLKIVDREQAKFDERVSKVEERVYDLDIRTT
jgi:predicted nuclease with TOPRIM domain